MFPHGRRDPEELESSPRRDPEELESSPRRDPEEFESSPRRDPEEFESTQIEEHLAVYPFDDDFQHPSASERSQTLSPIEELSSASDSYGKNSPVELFSHPGEKVEVILGKIAGDINRALSAKKQRMETNARQSFEGVEQKMKEVWNSHEDAMAQLNEETAQAFAKLFEQWNEDFKKFREKHEKLVNDFKQQEKVFQKSRFIQNQRLRTIKQVHEDFLKNLEDLEKRNDVLLTGTQSELKEEINKLRRKVLTES
ncbi:synaptonemal complex protein 3-like [Mastomys coucha]|uniref:synaptonemal complex protein 3-like n=1 Tax=Mastomys coucha TaxID=35658 RepID=UPI001262953B|nr:synaptonemal complex protein 3-like [Mastomys coucha]